MSVFELVARLARPESMSAAEQAGLVLALALLAYGVLGGADFGGGIWYLLASGREAAAQRQAIREAMGPVWEANHVWLIFALVVLFTAFPKAHAALSVALFVPFHAILVGLVVRGAALVLASTPAWQRAFGWASLLTPMAMGMSLAAVASGAMDGGTGAAPVARWAVPASAWLNPFVALAGLEAAALSAYMAAVLLAAETRGPIQETFRARALAGAALVALLSVALLLVARSHAPHLWAFLTRPRSLAMVALAVACGAAAARALAARRYALARPAALLQVAVLLGGWIFGQWPYLIYPHLTLDSAAAPVSTLAVVVRAALAGLAALVPALGILWWTFKRGQPTPVVAASARIRSPGPG